MNNFDEYQKMWKDQELTIIDEVSFDKQYPDLIEKLRKFQKKQFRMNLAKTIFIFLDLVFLIWILTSRLSSIFISLGLTTIMLSSIVFMVCYWGMQFNISQLNLLDTSASFLKVAVDKLAYQKQFFKKYLPLFGIIIVIGLNIVYLGLNNLTMAQQLILHVGMSSFLILAVIVGLKRQINFFKKVYQPLIDELTSILKTLNN